MNDKPHILYIEDNLDNQFLLKYYLRGEPYDITIAETGKKALSLITENTYDIFLVDLNLPDGVGGDEIIRSIRKSDHNKDKPVIVITAFTRQETKEAVDDKNIDYFITKPIRKKDFLDTLKDVAAR